MSKAKELLELMKQQDSKRDTIGTSFAKILAHPESFQHFPISRQHLLNIFSEDKLYLSVSVYGCVYKLYR